MSTRVAKRADKARRAQSDNERAASLVEGSVTQSIFGETVLGKNLGQNEESMGWDIYEVKHSGFTHYWSSAVVLSTFTTEGATH